MMTFSIEQALQIKAVLGWLGKHERWLIIADNADTEQVAKAFYDRFVPNLRGHVLVTSRLRRWPVTMPDLSLDLFLPEDATRFLLIRVAEGGHNAGDETTARKLAEELGYLPLALEQAAAFIIEVCWSFDNYYQQYREARPELLNYQTEGGTRYPASAAKTWSMTLDQLSPLGRALLRVAAWLAPDDIPREVFSTDRSVFAEALNADRKLSALSIEKALGELSRFSLIRLNTETVSVHRLLQAVEQDSLSAADKIKWIERAAQLLNAFTPEPAEDVTTQKIWIAVSEHADTLLRHAEEYHVRSMRIAITAHEYSQFLRSRGTYVQAERAARMALAITEDCSGPVELIAIRLGNLAMVLKETNQIREAESLLRRALRIDNDTQDADKRRIIVHLSNLGQLLQDSNRLDEAEKLITQACQMGEQYLDPNSPLMATLLNNLATLLQLMGRFEEAEPLLLRALEIDEKTVGKEHVNIATRLNNLAVLHVARREFGEAEGLFRKSLAIIERCFPKDHPRVALALSNLADVLHATGRVVEAKLLIEQALRIDRSSLVSGHPQLASHLFNIGVLLKDMGCLCEAEAYVRESFEHLISFASATGRLPSELGHVISTYRSVRLAEEHDPNEITLAIRELGRPLGFDICLWEFTDTGGAEISAVRTQLLALANQYEEIRRTMPSGDDRTRRMELVASKMRSLALPAYPLLGDLIGSESTGQRLAAVSILEAIPNTDHLPWLTERIAVEKPFIGYHAAIALLNAARNLRGSENHAAVQEAIHQALQNLDRKAWKDPNQLAVLENAEQELKWVDKVKR
jgi:tetratricopeptide (TPR) repeat protein